jgi:hypothetical protein
LPEKASNIFLSFTPKSQAMEKKKRKLVLKKNTVTQLTQNEQQVVAGGATFTGCASSRWTSPCVCTPI